MSVISILACIADLYFQLKCKLTTPSSVRALYRLLAKLLSVYKLPTISTALSGSRASIIITSNLSASFPLEVSVPNLSMKYANASSNRIEARESSKHESARYPSIFEQSENSG